ncbi:MAG: hypothetical protein R3B06_22860 [Kofleriaceae bacterium]
MTRPRATSSSVPRALAALVLVVGLVGVGGCKKKRSEPAPPPVPPPIAALDAIPADARVVVGLDLAQLADSALVTRTLAQLFGSDPDLAARFARLATECGVDVTRQIKTVHLALGLDQAGPVRRALLVATGQLDEVALSRCLQAAVGAGGGSVTDQPVGGRRLYTLVEGRRTVYFAFGRPDTVVIGPDRAWVEAALASGPKLSGSSPLAPYLAAVDTTRALWFAALMDPELGTAMVRITDGKVAAPPLAVAAELDPAEGLAGHAAFTMTSAPDAAALVTYAKGELAVGSLAAQAWGLGPVVGKIEVAQTGPVVHFRVRLTEAEFKDVLTAVDSGGGRGQDAPPAADPGPGPGSDGGSKAATD